MNKKILPILIVSLLTACQSINDVANVHSLPNLEKPTKQFNEKLTELNQTHNIPLNPYNPKNAIQICDDNDDKKTFCVKPYWHHFKDNGLNEFLKSVIFNHKEFAIASLQLQKSLIYYQTEQKNHKAQIGIGTSANIGGQYQKDNDDKAVYQNNRQFSINATASWELDLWQKLSLKRQMSDWQLLATQDDYRAVYLSLTHNAIKSYFTAKQLQYRLQLLQKKDDYYKQQEKFFQVRLKSGLIAENSRFSLQKSINAHNAQKLTVQNDLKNQQYELSTLSGLSIDDINILLKNNINHHYHFNDELYHNLTDDVIFNRPDVVSQFYKLKVALKQPELSKKSFYPTLILTNNLGLASEQLLTLIKVPVLSWGLALNIPTLNPNEIKRTLKLDNLDKEQAILAYQDVLQKSYQDFYEKLNAYQLAKSQFAIANSNEKIAKKQLEEQALLYKIGKISYADFLESNEEYHLAQEAVIEQKYAMLFAYLLVNQAVGGL